MMPERFGCYLYFNMGMTPVTICVYVAFSYEAAQSWLDERSFQQTKKRGAYIRELRRDDDEAETEPPPMLEQGELFPSDDDTRWCERQNKR